MNNNTVDIFIKSDNIWLKMGLDEGQAPFLMKIQ